MTIDIDGLRALAAFGPILAAPGFTFGAWKGGLMDAAGLLQMPWFELSAEASALVAAASANGFLVPGFDWGTWAQTPEAMRLMNDVDALDDAGADDLANVLTTVIRGERFVDGSLEAAFESGLLGRIVRRAAALSADE